MPSAGKDWLTTKQVAEMTGVTGKSVQKQAALGRGGAVKTAEGWLFPAGEIRALVNRAGQ